MTRYYMGIDGGGSNLRAVITDESMNIIAQTLSPETANPSSAGREKAAGVIKSAMQAVLQLAGIRPQQVRAVGIGIAGASSEYAADWLTSITRGVLSHARIAPSSDIEIALVGAHAARRGVIVLAGTGSVAYGVSAQGQGLLVGGWGYLLGDEGSGFWLGLQAIKAATRDYDTAPSHPSTLTARTLGALGVPTGRALIRKIYGEAPPNVRAIAELAPLVLEEAAHGDAVSTGIIAQGADALAGLVHTLKARLSLEAPPVALAGGLLQNDNPLSRALCQRLNLTDLPRAAYPPMIGAALLAKLTEEN